MVSARLGDRHTAKTNRFLAGVLRWSVVRRGIWPPRSPNFTPPDLFLWEFLKQSLPQYPKETEQTVVGTDIQILQNVAIDTVKNVECFSSRRCGGGGIPAFAVITHFHSLISFKKIKSIWYDMICYICQMQLGWHPVAVVQYTFTHKQYTEQHNLYVDIQRTVHRDIFL